MGIVIKSTALSDRPYIKSSIDHAVIASEKCITKADIDKNEIELIINVGIYREENISEPAI